jgi:hypothetical protein
MNAGRLLYDEIFLGGGLPGPVIVNGGTVGGQGIMGPLVANGGIVSPGLSPGRSSRPAMRR